MECLELVGTVHTGSLDQFIRNAFHVLFHHEDAESADHDRQDQRDICILQTGFHEHGISRDDGDRPRNHHRHHDKAEDNIFPFKLILAEYISAQAACIDHNRCNRYGNEDTVHEIPQKIKGLLEIHVVVDGRLLREQRLDDGLYLAVRLKGGEHHPHKREDGDDSEKGEHDV